MNAIVHERANAVTNEQQQKMREQAKINGKLNAKRIEKIRKMQQNLREKFIESNEFIRECNDKELCAQKRIDNETELQKQLQDDIDAVTKKTGDLRKFHDELKSAIAELKPYEEVLDQVVDEMELFTSKRDLLDRCDAIRKCRFSWDSFFGRNNRLFCEFYSACSCRGHSKWSDAFEID